ncbi:hypothetical protein N9H21_02585 [bacterium]|nr:hypothetical protein [bacterium]
MKPFLLRFVACLFVVISPSSHAALYDRGNGLIYDDVLDITWMQDANYAQTSGYAAANAVGSQSLWETGYGIQADGRMGLAAGNTWAAQLEYGGYDDWRLPSAGSTPTDGYNVTTGELGHMYYNNLGNTAHGSIKSWFFTDATPGGGTESFLNVQWDYGYWYRDEDYLNSSDVWAFYTRSGWQSYTAGTSDALSIWAVRDGDVSTVPIPTTAWLFGSALAGLLVARRKNKK